MSVRERDTPGGRFLDQALVLVGELFVDLARDVRQCGLGAASFRLLPEEQVIDVHICLRVVLSGQPVPSACERQMTRRRLDD